MRVVGGRNTMRIAVGTLLVLGFVCVAAAAAAGPLGTTSLLANTEAKALCSSTPPKHGSPTARCDAFALANSKGLLMAMSPAQVRATHGARLAASPNITASPDLNQPLWPDALHAAYQLPINGSSRTVAIVDAYDDPSIEDEIQAYDLYWNNSANGNESGMRPLPDCNPSAGVVTGCFEKVNQRGSTGGPFPAFDSGWSFEIALDVETIHTVCEYCKILLVEANDNTVQNLAAAANEAAALGATIISNSYGAPEGTSSDFVQQSNYDTYAPDYEHSGVVTVASTGDDAFVGGTQFPADVNSVVAVGGTTLSTSADGHWLGETAWYDPTTRPISGAGSGCTIFSDDPAQSWQTNAAGWSAAGCGGARGIADVAADANVHTGLYVYWSADPNDCTPPDCWWQAGGTSLAAPIIAATYALAGNDPNTISNLESIPYAHFRDLHDVTSGSTGSCGKTICRAAPGYDGPTGVGTPNGISGFAIGTPSVTSMSPTSGPAGTTVTIRGQNFTQASSVTVGLTPVRSFDVVSDVEITAVVGDGETGGVAVWGPGGVGASPEEFDFTPTIASFTPRGGGSSTSVTITGAGFTQPVQGGDGSAVNSVTFGGTAAASYTVDSETQITATTAPGTITGPITVTGAFGTGSSSTPFYAPPAISGISPGHGSAHTTVTISGTNLSGATHVSVNGTAAAFKIVSSSSITLTVPTEATTGTIDVTTPGGTASSNTFTVDPPPTITSFTPGTGTVGTPVTITGTNLQNVVGVEIGHIVTVPTSASPTQVVFTIPPGAASGPITLLDGDGSVTSIDTLTITG